MKHIRLLIFLGICLIVAGSAFGYFVVRVKAQEGLISDLTKRLTELGIPLKSIETQSQIPFSLNITLQRIDEQDKPLEPFYVHAVKREVTLARERGFGVDELTLVILSTKGNEEYRVTEPIKRVAEENPIPSGIDNDATAILIAKNLDLYGLNLDAIEVNSDQRNSQTASLSLHVPNIEIANKALPEFIPSLRPFLENLNKISNTRIRVFKVELFNDKADLLLRYVLDLELDQENWWMADGVTMDWFPHPLPENPTP